MLDASPSRSRSPIRRAPIDIVGTGGDRAHTINVSTIAALVVAGAGARVCKHGNRAASSSCGTADVLEALGVGDRPRARGRRPLRRPRPAWASASPRAFHPAMRYAGPPRRRARCADRVQLPRADDEPGSGAAQPHRVGRRLRWPSACCRCCASARHRRALIVHGDDGLDELTTTSSSSVSELRDGEVTSWKIDPVDLGFSPARPEELRGGDATRNAAAARAVLAGEPGPTATSWCSTPPRPWSWPTWPTTCPAGVELATAVLDDGRAAAALDRLVAVSQAAAAG